MKKTLFLVIFAWISFCGISQTWAPLYAGSSIMIDASALKNNKEYMVLINGAKIKKMIGILI